jgi:hypothetical protein
MSSPNTADIPQPITKNPRLPRYTRVKNPPCMTLTSRDMDVLRHLYSFRLMTREQIERLDFRPANGQSHPTKTSICCKRLKFLYQHGYVDRIPTPVRPGAWAWRPVYRLSRKGAELIAAERGTTIAQLSYWGKNDDQDHRTSQASLLFLEHALKINDVRIAVGQAAAENGYQLEKWIDEAQLKSQEMKDYVALASEPGRSVRVAVVPDAYFVLHLGNRRAHFFLELDRATMSNPRWKTRIRAYLTYIRSGKYQERYQTNSLRILTVTTTAQRMDNLRRTTSQAGGGDLFWFSILDQITASQVFSSPVWHLAGHETGLPPKPLLD